MKYWRHRPQAECEHHAYRNNVAANIAAYGPEFVLAKIIEIYEKIQVTSMFCAAEENNGLYTGLGNDSPVGFSHCQSSSMKLRGSLKVGPNRVFIGWAVTVSTNFKKIWPLRIFDAGGAKHLNIRFKSWIYNKSQPTDSRRQAQDHSLFDKSIYDYQHNIKNNDYVTQSNPWMNPINVQLCSRQTSLGY